MHHDPGPGFRALHRPGTPFILANAWDVGSARMLAGLGAQAIGTSSAAQAFTLGRPDGGISRDEALAHAEALVGATPLPVSGDFENGFGDAPETVAETVRMACDAGLAGISIEDAALPGGPDAYAFDLAVERIRAAAAAARALPRDFFLLARADGIMNAQYGQSEALRRIRAFDAAGADGLYVPLPATMQDLAEICAATSKPVNALAAGPFTAHTRAEYAAIGVARISLGSALARATHRLIHDAGEAMFGAGDFSALGHDISGSDVAALMARGAGQGETGAQ